MNFDVKDVKSWHNRHDVKVGDEGYVANGISKFRELNIDDAKCGKVSYIDNNWNLCFKSDVDPFTCYAFFLPLKAVKKEYRPFKDLYEFYKFISFGCFVAREDFTQNMLLKMGFTYREKKAPHIAHTQIINKIDFDLSDDPCSPSIEGRSLGLWFDYAEIINYKGDWQPFGIEVKEDD
jgi:hypothetical protein